ncbi:hypothetical protein M0R45_002455 [Rubus argutus]|uniref:Uncharacterized protein n=1 Tax=Rubus argutus TaxID=59490 RepID=A0AAW1VS30_RUBAR
MPLPWKKTGVGRISQMVADLQSPKRGGSLVVQTGFPTSLIDLFVKNRDCLRKQSKKHRKKTKPGKKSGFESVDRVSDPILTTSELGSGNLSILVRPSSSKIETLIGEEADHGVVEATEFRISGETDAESSEIVVEQSVGGGGDLSWVLVAVTKVFAVAVLALCTTKLAVWITLSAFLLLFLEYVGKHFVCLLKPCSNAKSVLQNMAQRVWDFLLVLRSDVIVKQKSEGVVFELVQEGVESDSSIEEIEIVKHNRTVSVCVDESVSQKSLIEYLIMDDQKWKKVEEGDHGDELSVSVCKKSKSKGRKKCAKMGAKLIKKFVPKKLRRRSKKHQSGPEPEPEPSSEDCVYLVEEGLVGQEDHIEGFSVEEEVSENGSVFSSLNSEQKYEKQGAEEISDHGKTRTFIDCWKEGNRKQWEFRVIRAWSRSADVPMPMKRCSLPISI